jgi:hypothetical protein
MNRLISVNKKRHERSQDEAKMAKQADDYMDVGGRAKQELEPSVHK